MGFFSSRKAEPTRLPPEGHEPVVIRSRFYGKNKNPAAHTPPVPSPAPVCAPEVYQPPASTGRPQSTDALTMSLAQRLNELAAANADGLLDDEEYRLLRQNIFERFAATSDSPPEPSVMPTRNRDPYRHASRTPSIDSQRSIATAMSSLFRRATGRSGSLTSPTPSAFGSATRSVLSLQQHPSPAADSFSVYSRPSVSSELSRPAGLPRSIARRPSDDSLMSMSQAGSTSGSVTNDLRGIMSRSHVLGAAPLRYTSSISSRATTRSAKPPSSFHLRPHTAPTHVSPIRNSRTHEYDEDDDHPKSTAELRSEIESVESEGRKLLDAFNGLELTALTKSRAVGLMSAPPDENPTSYRLQSYPEPVLSSTLGSSYTLITERAASVRRNGHTPSHAVPLIKQPIILKRKPSVVGSIAGSFKASSSDLRSSFLSTTPTLHNSHSSPNLLQSATAPLAPALPTSASTSAAHVKMRPSILRQKQPPYPVAGLSRSPHTAPPVSIRASPMSHRTNANGTDPTLHALEAELADIRRRKADVSARYERRLEFLRAKLKSAEIRERLSKK